MLVVTFRNDGTGTEPMGNYDVEVLITTSPQTLQSLWKGRVEGHDRRFGWRGLVALLGERE